MNLVLGLETYVIMTTFGFELVAAPDAKVGSLFSCLDPTQVALLLRTRLLAQGVGRFSASEVCEKRASQDMLEQCSIPSHAVGLISSKWPKLSVTETFSRRCANLKDPM